MIRQGDKAVSKAGRCFFVFSIEAKATYARVQCLIARAVHSNITLNLPVTNFLLKNDCKSLQVDNSDTVS